MLVQLDGFGADQTAVNGVGLAHHLSCAKGA